MSWVLLAAAVVLLPVSPRTRLAGRLAGGGPGPGDPAGSEQRPRAVLRVAGSVGAAVAALLFIGGGLGMLVAPGVGLLAWRLLSPEAALAERERLRAARALPDAVALVAVLLRAGLPEAEVVEVVAGVTDGPLGARFAAVARARRLGEDAATAWRGFGDDPVTSALADAMVRFSGTGAPIAGLLERIGVDARREFQSAAREAARSAGVRAVLPLGLCYLPSFLLLAVIPLVASLLGELSW